MTSKSHKSGPTLKSKLLSTLPEWARRRVFLRLALNPRHWPGLFGLALILVIRGFIPLRIGWLWTKRIGHFVGDVSLMYAERHLYPEKAKFDVYCLEPTHIIPNKFWLQVAKRNFRITPLIWPTVKILRDYDIEPPWLLKPWYHVSGTRDLKGYFHRSGVTIPFLPEEDSAGKKWLKSVGHIEGQPIVCLHVRDSAYLKNRTGQEGRPEDSYSHHDYKDSDISTYVDAAEWLAEQGALVLRMGQLAEKRLNSTHPRVIDYAFREDKSDFLDVWLMSSCSLFIGTASGPSIFAESRGIPVLWVNYLPFGGLATWTNCIGAGKALYNSAGKRLSLREHLNMIFHMTEEYADMGVRIRDLSSQEIKDSVMEAWNRALGSWIRDESDVRNREEFLDELSNSEANYLHGYIHPKTRALTCWMEQLKGENENPDKFRPGF